MLLCFLLFPHRWDYAAGDQAVTGCRHNRATSQAVCASFRWVMDVSVCSLGWDKKKLSTFLIFSYWWCLWTLTLSRLWVRFLRRRLIDVNARKSHPLMSVLSDNSQPSHFLRCSLALTVREIDFCCLMFPWCVLYNNELKNILGESPFVFYEPTLQNSLLVTLMWELRKYTSHKCSYWL